MRISSLTLTILAFLLAHLALAAAIPLIEDEAYYALWATGLDWDYYDHPPLIAWAIAAGEALAGANRIGVRLLPLLCVPLTSLAVAGIAVAGGASDRGARIAVLWFNAGFLIFILGFAATPDAPSILFWAAALWAVVRALENPRFWLLAGLFAGLGVMSKFTNLFLGPGLLLWLIGTAVGRGHLKTIWPWAGGLLALAIMSPLIWWNIAHDGLGLERQFGRIGNHGVRPRLMAEYLFQLAVLGSPLLLWAALKSIWRGPAPVVGLIVATSAPVLAYFLWHAATSPIQPNWLAPVYAPLAVLAGLAAGGWRKWVLWLGTALGLAPALALLALGFWPGPPVFSGHVLPNQTKGWPAFSAELETIVGTSGTDWIATTEYGLTGALAFRLPGHDVHAVDETFRYGFRGAFPIALCDAPALLVQRRQTGLRRPDELFNEVGPPVTLTRRSAGAAVTDYRVWPVRGLKTCPPAS